LRHEHDEEEGQTTAEEVVGIENSGGEIMNGKIAKERAKEIVQHRIDAGEVIRLGRGHIISAKDFFALPLEKQIELKHSVPRLAADHWRKGQPRPASR
jgi:hypothetical protein